MSWRERMRRDRCLRLMEVNLQMVRWHASVLKASIALGGVSSLLVLSGAGLRWGEALGSLLNLF
jgi:hypothetical protein